MRPNQRLFLLGVLFWPNLRRLLGGMAELEPLRNWLKLFIWVRFLLLAVAFGECGRLILELAPVKNLGTR